MAVFGSFLNAFVVALLLGVVGGFAAELISNEGSIEFPHLPATSNLLDMGVAANLLLGAVAALVYFSFSKPLTRINLLEPLLVLA